MPLSIFQSTLKGDDISEAIAKILRLDNVSVILNELPSGAKSTVDVQITQMGYTYTFGIPQGRSGLYDSMVTAGFHGTQREFYEQMLNLLQPTRPYEHLYLQRFTHAQMAVFTHSQLNA